MAAKDHTYRIPGGKTGVLLIHGLCGTPTEMRYVANGLARAGYTVLCPQLAGHCGSEADLANSTWQDWYATCEAGLEELRTTCDTVIVGGLSTGALLALVLAADHPDTVQGVTLYAPVLWLNGWLIPWYARLFRIIGNKKIANMIPFPDLHPHGIKDDRIREFILSAMKSGDASVAGLISTPGGAVLEHRWLSEEVRRLVPAIHQRVLILHPREDDYADLSNAHYLQRKLPGSVEMVVLEDSYHIITIDRQRDVVVEKSAAFVEGVKREIAKPKRKVAKLPAATATAATGKAAARRPAAQALPAAA